VFRSHRYEVGRHGRKLTEAHVWSTSTIHIARLCVPRSEPKIGEFDRYPAFILASVGVEGMRVSDHKVLRFDVSMEDAVTVAVSDGFTHLRKHG
jgi:hypothetical protein